MISYQGTGEACRFCGEPSWTIDEEGHVHRCCAVAESEGAKRCVPCIEGRKLRRKRIRYL